MSMSIPFAISLTVVAVAPLQAQELSEAPEQQRYVVPVADDPIVVGGDVFDLGKHAFPTKVEIVDQVVTSSSITDSDTYLEGADLTGWRYGMTRLNQVKCVFQAPIEDQPGDDVYFGQGRLQEYGPPTGDRHALEFSFDGVAWHYLGHLDFTLASTRWYLPRTTANWWYQLHRSSIDLADYGVTEPITHVYVRGVEYLNLVLVGNLNAGAAVDTYEPLTLLFPEAVSYVQGGQTQYNEFYRATLFAHDASGIQKTVLWQRVQGTSAWAKVDTDLSVSSTIGGTFGGHFRLTHDYSGYATGTVMEYRHVIVDERGNRARIVKRLRIEADGSLTLLD